jgi:hypothetical protein
VAASRESQRWLRRLSPLSEARHAPPGHEWADFGGLSIYETCERPRVGVAFDNFCADPPIDLLFVVRPQLAGDSVPNLDQISNAKILDGCSNAYHSFALPQIVSMAKDWAKGLKTSASPDPLIRPVLASLR